MQSAQQPPPDEASEVPDADPESVARAILLDALTGRARSRAELAERLRRKNVPEELGEQLLDRFTEVGLIDDAQFAHAWVHGRQQAKGLARRVLAQELRRKGVDDEIARDALDTLESTAEEEAARRLVQRKLRSLHGVDDPTATRRLAGMLARRGYPSSLVFRVVREELAAAGRDADEDEPL